MRKTYFTHALILLSFFIFQVLEAQVDCSGGDRYINEIFPNLLESNDIVYGQNLLWGGQNQVLLLDVYEPQGDQLPMRPLIVMAHGGSFIFGNKDQSDIKPLAEIFARKGYVTASINYRLGMEGFPFPGPDSSSAVEEVMRAVQDAKAAVRFFYKDAATTNTFRIDTSRIYFMGSSAGAFIGIHYAYLDQESEIPVYGDTTKPGLSGGLEGNSGNPGYPSRIKGVVNLSGAIGDTSWMQPGDEPILSLHGTNDDVVPYGSEIIKLTGTFELLQVDGSSSMALRADHIGLFNCFHTFPGAGHVPYVGNATYTDTVVNFATRFLYGLVCGDFSSCEYIAIGLAEELLSEKLIAYPNPAADFVRVDIPGEEMKEVEGQLVDLYGKVQRSIPPQRIDRLEIWKEELSPGLYFLNLTSNGKRYAGKIIFR